jgi:hypothetical protein
MREHSLTNAQLWRRCAHAHYARLWRTAAYLGGLSGTMGHTGRGRVGISCAVLVPARCAVSSRDLYG